MSLPLPVRNPELFNEVAQWLCRIPHSRILQIEFIQAERGRATDHRRRHQARAHALDAQGQNPPAGRGRWRRRA